MPWQNRNRPSQRTQVLDDPQFSDTSECFILGRIEYTSSRRRDRVVFQPKWHRLEAIGMVINETKRDGRMTNQVRYYILIRKMQAKEFGQAVRGHWGIENQLHWQLDVSYQEDKCRVRQGHADANLAIIRRFTLYMLKANKTEKMGIKNKRLFAGWDNDYCQVVLAGQRLMMRLPWPQLSFQKNSRAAVFWSRYSLSPSLKKSSLSLMRLMDLA
ncbi:MAG: ISAs1 family transposase [Gemmataceae bacterium]|nr:ISAs1 family transposase [Gemmataceae bacterium]